MDVERPPRLLPRLVLWIAGVVLAFVVLGWMIGVVFSILRTLLLAAIALAVIWAVVAILANRRR